MILLIVEDFAKDEELKMIKNLDRSVTENELPVTFCKPDQTSNSHLNFNGDCQSNSVEFVGLFTELYNLIF